MQEEQRLASTSSVQGSTSFKSEDDSIGQATLESDMDKSIVRLNTVTEGRPLFIIHGAGGGVLVMQKVAQKAAVLVGRLNVIGLCMITYHIRTHM